MAKSGSLSRLPRVDAVLDDPRLADWPRAVAREETRAALDEGRTRLRAGESLPDDWVDVVARRLQARFATVLLP